MVEGKGSTAPASGTADRQGEPSTSTAHTNGPASKPRRFKPTVTQRRKKDDGTQAVKVEEDDCFKDLIRQAQEPANWEQRKGAGNRNQTHGRGQAQTQTVAFGASRTGASGRGVTTTSRAAPSTSGRKAGPSTSNGQAATGRSGQSPSGKGRLVRASGQQVAPKPEGMDWTKAEDDLAAVKDLELGPEDPIDYDTYYPSILPARPPGTQLDQQLDASAALPEDLSLVQADERNVAETLGLLQKENGNQPLFLFHMPPLPAAPKQADTKDLSQQRHRLLAASSSNSQSSTPALTDFPPGNLGKLLVYESGKAKLLVGDALLDVELGSNAFNFQQLLALHPEANTAIILGEVSLRAFCAPNADQLLSSDPLPSLQARPPSKPETAPEVKEDPLAATEPKASENGGSPIQMGALRRGKQVLEDSDDEDAMKCE